MRVVMAPLERSRIDSFLRPYLSDVALWPVTFVVLVIVAMFGAAALLLALRGRNYAAMAALALLGVMSADVMWTDLKSRRLGVLSGLVAGLWGLSGVAAFLAVQLGGF